MKKIIFSLLLLSISQFSFADGSGPWQVFHSRGATAQAACDLEAARYGKSWGITAVGTIEKSTYWDGLDCVKRSAKGAWHGRDPVHYIGSCPAGTEPNMDKGTCDSTNKCRAGVTVPMTDLHPPVAAIKCANDYFNYEGCLVVQNTDWDGGASGEVGLGLLCMDGDNFCTGHFKMTGQETSCSSPTEKPEEPEKPKPEEPEEPEEDKCPDGYTWTGTTCVANDNDNDNDNDDDNNNPGGSTGGDNPGTNPGGGSGTGGGGSGSGTKPGGDGDGDNDDGGSTGGGTGGDGDGEEEGGTGAGACMGESCDFNNPSDKDKKPEYGDTFTKIKEGIEKSPIGSAVGGINVSSGGSCPAPTISIFNRGYVLDAHCKIFDQAKPVLRVAAIAMWCLLAVIVFLSS